MMKMKVILFLSILVLISFKESQSFLNIIIKDKMANTTKHMNGNINETFDKSIKSRTIK